MTRPTPSFSIVTCTWNSEPFLAQCIASVQAQTHARVEHVFVDGGSTDGTLERIQALGSDVRWVTNVRGGISRAMNEGARMATGDVIAHLHGDDYYLDADVLADVATAFVESGADWVFGRIVSDIAGTHMAPTWAMPPFSLRRLLNGNFIAHPATFVSRRLFEATGGFDESLKYAMDYDLWLRLAAAHAPAYLPRALAAFRRHGNSLSTANALQAFEEDHQVRLRYLPHDPLSRLMGHARYVVRRRRLQRAQVVAAEASA